MSKHTSALPPLAPADHKAQTAWHLFWGIILPAAGAVLLLTLIPVALPLLNIFEIGLVAALGILAHAWWRSREAVLKQLQFGAQSFVIASLLSVIPAHAVSVFMGREGLFAPVPPQFSLVEFTLYSSLVFSVLLTFYYWIIFMIWDHQYQSQPKRLWLTVLSASLLVIAAQFGLERVSGEVLTLLLSLLILALMFFSPILWIVELERDALSHPGTRR